MGIFLNNPFVCGFTIKKSIISNNMLKGNGHLIQRLERGFGVSIQDTPKPEIYLSMAEIEWATQERQKWPQGRPVCILSTRVVTDKGQYDFTSVNWDAIASAWSKVCVVVQPVITGQMHYERFIRDLTPKMKVQWEREQMFAKSIVYENLSLRQYMSLFAVADYHCGGTSGGAHIAAAFNVPSAIVIWRSLRESLQFPSHARGWKTLNFLYPQHHFILAEDCEKGQRGYKWLDTAIENLVDRTPKVIEPNIIERPSSL
jgi:ADP-heptose:LPS heptosyltransferase